MEQKALEKAKPLNIGELIEYIPGSILIKSIIKKTTGFVNVSSFETGESITEKVTRFDTLVQIVDGKAEVVIDDISNILETGQSIIIPANSHNTIRANVRFKMISTVIKSGYEQ